jgi:hypothetical protein
MAPPRVIAIDFDGVIHSFTSGWQGALKANDPIVPGIKEVIAELRQDYRVIVMSSRCLHPGGTKTIETYLNKYGIIVDGITGEKIPALVYVDDRAITFRQAEGMVDQIRKFEPWHRGW